MPPRRPASGLTLSDLRTRPRRGGGRLEGHGADAGSGGCGHGVRAPRPRPL